MCGIALLLDRRDRPVDSDALARVTGGLAHRGPDDRSVFTQGPVGLGHTRLAIMDPEDGRQPMVSEDGAIVAVYNGEIYNHRSLRAQLEAKGHRFASHTDGEVIPHLYEEYGTDAFLRLDGMFAIVLYDLRNQRICVARDRLGIKPLVIYTDPAVFLCASELGALLRHPAVPRRIDRQSVADFLTFGYPMGPRTVFAGLESFPAGEVGVYDLRTHEFRCRPYWRPNFPRHHEYESTDWRVLTPRLRHLFAEVLADHAEADVPVTCYLSGGLDSSGIAAGAARLRDAGAPPMTAFSLHFPQAGFDESGFAAQVAQRAGLDLRRVAVPDCTLDGFEAAVLAVEQPQVVTLDAASQSLSAAARAAGFKVALTGDGADELLGGYNHFCADAWRRRLSGQPGFATAMTAVLERLGYPEDFHPLYLRLVQEEGPKAEAMFGLVPPWYPIWALNARIARPLLRDAGRDPLGPDGPLAVPTAPLRGDLAGVAPLNKAIFLEMRTRLPWWVLWKSDRNAMSNGVEVRVPYLDNRMIDFFAGLPPYMKMGRWREKSILRDGFAGLVPKAVRHRGKFAFNTPLDWVLGWDEKALDRWLGPDALRRTDVFNAQAVAGLMARVRDPRPVGRGFLHTLERRTLVGVLTAQMLFLHHGFR